MESKKLVTKSLLLSAAYPGAFCAILLLVIAQYGHLTPKMTIWICAGLAIIYIPSMGSVLAQGLIAVATHPEPILLDPETIELRAKTRALRRKMTVLALLIFVLCMTGGVMLSKYQMTYMGLTPFIISSILLLPYLRAAKSLRSLLKSAKASSPAPVKPTHERSDKGRIYAICISLMCLSVFPAVVLPAGVYFIVTGTRTTFVYCVIATSIAALASIPFFSGLIVRKLGLPESIEIQ